MYRNEPFADFTEATVRTRYQQALDAVEQQIARGALIAKPIIDGKSIEQGETQERRDPSCTKTVIGKSIYATAEQCEQAIHSLKRGSARWRDTPVKTRAAALMRAAEKMRSERYALSALITREVGKSWAEADADICEAIDFCTYYAAEMERLGTPQKLGDIPGEENWYFYQPRGIAVVIAPWNFPLAIACGMVVAALVTGNPTILKPAEQSNLIAHRLAEILLASGIPADAFAFLPGVGEVVGRTLVHHRDVAMICFTGSKAVGLEIISKASQTPREQHHVKRVVAEMGGKNAIIVDEDADLDEAVKGTLQSAFGFSGQKCSACSRLIVVGSAYEPLLKRLADAAKDIISGEARDPATFLGPVVDEESQTRILRTIDEAAKEHALLFRGTAPSGGYYVPAAIFRDVNPGSSLWREEIFGPVLACLQAQSFDEALAIANDSQYALTGGVFSRSPANLTKARNEFRVGNLYLNRKCTGALVFRQPFGGFKMSGIGSKAGGPDYLLQFMEPRVVTENLMRRGFAPEQRKS